MVCDTASRTRSVGSSAARRPFWLEEKIDTKQIIELQCRRAQGALIKTLMHD
jgi:hypothetical protein